jgi:hypothetical protein
MNFFILNLCLSSCSIPFRFDYSPGHYREYSEYISDYVMLIFIFKIPPFLNNINAVPEHHTD